MNTRQQRKDFFSPSKREKAISREIEKDPDVCRLKAQGKRLDDVVSKSEKSSCIADILSLLFLLGVIGFTLCLLIPVLNM
jgi:hypothetical protein